MTSQGAAQSVSRLRRAIKTCNMLLIRSAAAELPDIGLPDALQVCLVVRDAEPARYEAAAVRWIARLCTEYRTVELADVEAATAAFVVLRADPETGLQQLQQLMRRHL